MNIIVTESKSVVVLGTGAKHWKRNEGDFGHDSCTHCLDGGDSFRCAHMLHLIGYTFETHVGIVCQ